MIISPPLVIIILLYLERSYTELQAYHQPLQTVLSRGWHQHNRQTQWPLEPRANTVYPFILGKQQFLFPICKCLSWLFAVPVCPPTIIILFFLVYWLPQLMLLKNLCFTLVVSLINVLNCSTCSLVIHEQHTPLCLQSALLGWINSLTDSNLFVVIHVCSYAGQWATTKPDHRAKDRRSDSCHHLPPVGTGETVYSGHCGC